MEIKKKWTSHKTFCKNIIHFLQRDSETTKSPKMVLETSNRIFGNISLWEFTTLGLP